MLKKIFFCLLASVMVSNVAPLQANILTKVGTTLSQLQHTARYTVRYGANLTVLNQMPLLVPTLVIPSMAVIGGVVGFTFSKKAIRGVIGGMLLGALTGIGVSAFYGDAVMSKLAYVLAYYGINLAQE